WNKALDLALEQLNEDFLFNLLRQDTKESKKKFLKFFNSLKTKKFGSWVVNLIIKYPDQKQNVDRRKRLFVDLGEIHPFACYDEPNNQFVLFNGR
ncbi:MAG: hypothetical protein ABGX24_05570, partial [Aquificota bacterium]